jgi:RNA polymerase sigma-70 factor (ECF subfamily)
MHTELCESLTPVSKTAPEGPTNEELMARVQQQDEQALGELYQRHSPLLRTVISHVVNNDQDVDDLIQEVFLEFWNLASHYDPAKGKVLGWIVTLARRRAIDRLRRKQAYSRAAERMRTELAPEPSASESVEADAMADDASEILQGVIARLPDAQREAIHLAYYRGLSQREIAAQTGIPLGTIKTRLDLAVRKVRGAVLALGGRSAWRSHSRNHSRRHAVMPSRVSFE